MRYKNNNEENWLGSKERLATLPRPPQFVYLLCFLFVASDQGSHRMHELDSRLTRCSFAASRRTFPTRPTECVRVWPLLLSVLHLVLYLFFSIIIPLDFQYLVVLYVVCVFFVVFFCSVLLFFCLFCLKSAPSSAAASPPRPPPSSRLLPSSSGRRGSRGAGGVPPRRPLRLGALHPTAAIPSPAYRGASKPLPQLPSSLPLPPGVKCTEKLEGRRVKVVGWAAKVEQCVHYVFQVEWLVPLSSTVCVVLCLKSVLTSSFW